MIQFLLGGLAAVVKVAGPVVANLATNLVAKLPTIVETAIKVLKTIAPVVKVVAEILDILKPDDDLEELGKKTMQEGTRPKMEDESMEEYFDYLRNEVKLDEERWKNITEEDKLKANAIGVSMATAAISEKTKVEVSPDFLLAMKKMEMSADHVAEYIQTFGENGIDSLDSLTGYLRGELSGDEKKNVLDVVKETEGKLHPDFSNGEILAEINSLKDKIGD